MHWRTAHTLLTPLKPRLSCRDKVEEESQNYVKVISHLCPIPEEQEGHQGAGGDDGCTVPWHITNTAGQG